MKKLVLALFLMGLGAAGGYFGRPFAEPLVGGPREVDAVVVSERTEESRLVLTLRMGDETMLATFHNRSEDVAELVAPGDTITLRMRSSGVFADDAPILRVSRPSAEPPAETPDEAAPPAEGEAEGETEHVAQVERAPSEATTHEETPPAEPAAEPAAEDAPPRT